MGSRAVILTGGRSRRFGGRHKPAVPVDGTPVLARTTDSLLALRPAPEVWVAGPADGLSAAQSADVRRVEESPRFAGPLAGIAAALHAMPVDEHGVVLLLAGDVPYVRTADLAVLVAAAGPDAPASCRDDAGHLQYLCAAWPEPVLRRRLEEIGQVADRPLRILYEGLDPVIVDIDPGSFSDFDTPDDYRRLTRADPPPA